MANLPQEDELKRQKALKEVEVDKCMEVYRSWKFYFFTKVIEIAKIQGKVNGIFRQMNESLQKEIKKVKMNKPSGKTNIKKMEAIIERTDDIRAFSGKLHSNIERLGHLQPYLNERLEILETLHEILYNHNSTIEQIQNIEVPNFHWAENNFCPEQIETLKLELDDLRMKTNEKIIEYNIDTRLIEGKSLDDDDEDENDDNGVIESPPNANPPAEPQEQQHSDAEEMET